MRHRWKILATAVSALSAVVLAPASPAHAATCSPSHCYAVVEWNRSTTLHGLSEVLNVSCLTTANPSSNFVTEEMWLGTGSSSTGQYWVEEGMAYGAPQGASRYYFWADNRPNGGGYHEHDLTISASLHTNYVDDIIWIPPNSWGVYRGGTSLGTSTVNGGTSLWESTGEETTNTSAQAAATMTGLWYKNTSDTWVENWTGAGYRSDNPPYGAWITRYSGWEAYSNCSFAATTPAAPANPFATADAPSVLSGIAHEFAANNGERSPRDIGYRTVNRQDAVRALSHGDGVDSNQPVYLITESGSFTGAIAKVPAGQAQPGGGSLAILVDPATGRVTDWSILPATPDTSAFGAASPLN
jgi:hypothetical protein